MQQKKLSSRLKATIGKTGKHPPPPPPWTKAKKPPPPQPIYRSNTTVVRPPQKTATNNPSPSFKIYRTTNKFHDAIIKVALSITKIRNKIKKAKTGKIEIIVGPHDVSTIYKSVKSTQKLATRAYISKQMYGKKARGKHPLTISGKVKIQNKNINFRLKFEKLQSQDIDQKVFFKETGRICTLTGIPEKRAHISDQNLAELKKDFNYQPHSKILVEAFKNSIEKNNVPPPYSGITAEESINAFKNLGKESQLYTNGQAKKTDKETREKPKIISRKKKLTHKQSKWEEFYDGVKICMPLIEDDLIQTKKMCRSSVKTLWRSESRKKGKGLRTISGAILKGANGKLPNKLDANTIFTKAINAGYAPEVIPPEYLNYFIDECTDIGLFEKNEPIRIFAPCCGWGGDEVAALNNPRVTKFLGVDTSQHMNSPIFKNMNQQYTQKWQEFDPNIGYYEPITDLYGASVYDSLRMGLFGHVKTKKKPENFVVKNEAIEDFVLTPNLKGSFNLVYSSPPYGPIEQYRSKLSSLRYWGTGPNNAGMKNIENKFFTHYLDKCSDALQEGGVMIIKMPFKITHRKNGVTGKEYRFYKFAEQYLEKKGYRFSKDHDSYKKGESRGISQERFHRWVKPKEFSKYLTSSI